MPRLILHRAPVSGLAFFCACLLAQACHDGSTNPVILPQTIVQTDTVPTRMLPTKFDTLTLYARDEEEWGLDINVARADSFASYLAKSELNVKDMWYPLDIPMCLMTVTTFSVVYIRTERPDTLLQNSGFTATGSFTYCYQRWKHYGFIRASFPPIDR